MKLFSKCREDLVTVIEQKLSIFDDNGMFAGQVSNISLSLSTETYNADMNTSSSIGSMLGIDGRRP